MLPTSNPLQNPVKRVGPLLPPSPNARQAVRGGPALGRQTCSPVDNFRCRRRRGEKEVDFNGHVLMLNTGMCRRPTRKPTSLGLSLLWHHHALACAGRREHVSCWQSGVIDCRLLTDRCPAVGIPPCPRTRRKPGWPVSGMLGSLTRSAVAS